MTAYLFGSFTLVAAFAIIQFRRGEIYSGAVLGQTAVIVGLWAIWVAVEDRFTPTRVDVFIPWPIPEDALWTMLTVVMVFAISFVIGQRLSSILMQSRVGSKRLVYFPPFEQQSASISNKKLFDIGFLGTIVLVLLTAEGWWIFAPYPESKQIWAVVTFIPQASLIAIAGALLVLHAGLSVGGKRKLLGVLLVLGLVVHGLLAGQRGYMLVLMMGSFAIVFYQAVPRMRRWLIVGAVASIYPIFTLMSNISQWRHILLTGRGLEWTHETSLLEWLDSIPNIWKTMPDTYRAVEVLTAHSGYMEGRFMEFMLIFVRQIIPGRILEAMGLELYNGPYALAEFFRHGGGFYSPAEMYFLSGYLAVVVLSLYFGVLAAVLDRIWQKAIRLGVRNMVGNPVFLLTVLATIGLPRTLYGLQTWHRLITLPIIFLVVFEVWRRQRKRRIGGQKVARFGAMR